MAIVLSGNWLATSKKLTSFVFENDIDILGFNLFYGTNLKEIYLSNVTTVEDNFLQHKSLSSLETIRFPTGSFNYSITDIASRPLLSNLRTIYLNNVSSVTEISGLNSLPALETVVFTDCTMTTLPKMFFDRCTNLKNITIPASITSFGDTCFGSCGFTRVDLTQTNVAQLCGGTYQWCIDLQSIELNNLISNIPNYTFRMCSSLNQIDLNNITSIGSYAFASCWSLKNVNLNSNIKTIRTNTFKECRSLRQVNGSKYITTLDGTAFQGCSSLLELDITNVTSFIGGTLTGLYSLTSFTYPKTIDINSLNSVIGDLGSNYTQLEYLNLDNNNLTGITTDDFNRLNQLTSLNTLVFPTNPKENFILTFPNNAFSDLDNLTSLTFTLKHTSAEYIFNNNNVGLQKLNNSNLEELNVTFQDQNRYILNGAVKNSNKLTDLTLSNSFSIAADEFNGCSNLHSLNLSRCTNTQLDNNTFLGCNQLINLVLPINCTNIPKSLSSCTGLTDLILPDKITNLEFGQIIGHLGSLNTINIPNECKSVDASCFYKSNGHLTVTNASVLQKLSGIGDYAFANTILEPATTLTVGTDSRVLLYANTFAYSLNLTEINIDVNKIVNDDRQNQTFARCQNLNKATFNSNGAPKGVDKIVHILDDCIGLTEIRLNGFSLGDFGLTRDSTYSEIRDAIAYNLTYPTIYLDDYIASEAGAFYYPLYFEFNGNNIINVIPENLPEDGKILIPRQTENINANIFKSSHNIAQINVETVPAGLNASGIKTLNNLKIVIDDVAIIPSNAFKDCSNIIEFEFKSENLAQIGADAFSGTIVQSFNIDTNNTLLMLLDNCFNNTDLTSITFSQLGSTFFNRSGSVFEIRNNSNSTGLNVKTLVYTSENAPLDYPQFIVTNHNLTCYSEKGYLVNPNDTQTYVKYIPKSVNIDSDGYVKTIEQTYIAQGGYIPDDAFFGLSGIRSGAFTNKTSLHKIIIPSDIGFDKIEDKAFETEIAYDLSICMQWCTFDEFMQKWNSKIYELGISSNSGAKVYLSDAIVYSDGSYDTKATVENEEFIVGFFDNKYNDNTPEWTLIRYDGLSTVVDIPDYITVIRDNAFTDLPDLTQVNINNVTTIYENAFVNCENLTNLGDYSRVSSIGIDAFTNCGFTRFTLPIPMTELGDFGFSTCKNLTTIRVHNRLTSIADNALFDDKQLSSLMCINRDTEAEDILSTLVNIGENALQNATSLSITNVFDDSTLTSIGQNAFYNSFYINDSIATNINATEDVETILEYSFYNSKIDGVSINSKVIEKYAFYGSTLSSLSLGTNLLSIEQDAFANCPNSFSADIPETIQYIGNNVFENWNLGDGTNYFVINNKFDNISTLNENLYIQGTDEYQYYDNIFSFQNNTKIYTDKSEKYRKHFYVYDYKMIPCPSYLSIDLDKLAILKLIDPERTDIYLPEYVIEMDSTVFKENKFIEQIYCNITNLKLINEAFLNCEKLQRIINVYQNDDYVMPLELTSLYDKEFCGCLSIDNLTIGNNITEIPPSCFYNCQSLNTYYSDYNRYFLNVDNKISAYGKDCFYNCKSFKTLIFADCLSLIDGNIVSGCNSLSVVNINLSSEQFISRLSTANEHTLYSLFKKHLNPGHKILIRMLDADYDNDTGNYYDNGLIIEDGVILYATSPYVRIPDIIIGGAYSIGDYAFTECDYLHQILFYNDKELSGTIGDYAFYNCSNLEYLNTLSNELYVTSIGAYAFYNCANMKSIILDCQSLTHIGSGAFYGTNINSITLRNVTIQQFKQIINWTEENKNPLQLQNTCQIRIEKTKIGNNGEEIISYELYTYVLDDITNMKVGINPNTVIYTDKTVKSVKAVLIVPAASEEANSTGILGNTFHCNIIGRYNPDED